MNTTLYIIVCWAVLLTLLYSYMFYDIYAERIKLHEKWSKLVNAFTEEE